MCAIYFPNTHPQLSALFSYRSTYGALAATFLYYKITTQKHQEVVPPSAHAHSESSSLLIFPSLPSLRRLVSFNLFHLIPLHQAEVTHAQHRGKQGKASPLPLHGTNVSPASLHALSGRRNNFPLWCVCALAFHPGTGRR